MSIIDRLNRVASASERFGTRDCIAELTCGRHRWLGDPSDVDVCAPFVRICVGQPKRGLVPLDLSPRVHGEENMLMSRLLKLGGLDPDPQSLRRRFLNKNL